MANTDDLENLRLKMALPHIAAASRRVLGYKEGSLKCEHCGAMTASRNRQRTAYENDESNFATLCPTCQREADEYWSEMWNEYYRDRL